MEVTSVQTTPLTAAQNKPSKISSTTPFQSSPLTDVTLAGSTATHENGLQIKHSNSQPESAISKSTLVASEPQSAMSSPSHVLHSSSSSTSNSAKQSPSKKPRSGRKSRNGQQPSTSNMMSVPSTPRKTDSLPESPNKDNSLNDEYKVEITGFQGFVRSQDLHSVLNTYGQVKIEEINKRYAVVIFQTKELMQKALKDSNKVCLYGNFLSVKPYTGVDDHFKKQKNKDAVAAGTVDPQTLPLGGEFGAQLDALLAAVRLTQEEVGALATLYADVERVLQQLWPGCQAMPFGSITTGLGVKSSDADCFVDVPLKYRPAQYGFVNRAKRVLLQHPHLFSEVFAIPRANTPIVKLRHVPTATRCDLSFKTPLGALNSKLVAFLLHVHASYVPLAIVVKYWAAVHALSGTGRITNYALTLLLVFYLQRLGLLPPVAALQREPAHTLIVDGWSAGFAADYALLPPAPAPPPPHELLGGFFSFYNTFDFERLVVCPLLGAPVAKALLAEPARVPPEFERYRAQVAAGYAAPFRHRSPLCVQDPFELSHNVASSVTPRLAADVRAYIKFAAEAYARERPAGCAGLLRAILLDKPRLERPKSSPEYRASYYPRLLDRIVRDDWKAAVRDALMTIFEKILKVKLTPAEKETYRSGRDKERFTASLSKPLWKRQQPHPYDLVRMGFVESESRMTEEMMRLERAFPPVEFQVILSFSPKYRGVTISIKMVNGDREVFNPFGKYYMFIMQTWLELMLEDMGSISKESVNRQKSTNEIGGNDVKKNVKSDGGDVKRGSEPSRSEETRRSTEAPRHNKTPQPIKTCAQLEQLPKSIEACQTTKVLVPAETTESKEISQSNENLLPMEVQASDCQ